MRLTKRLAIISLLGTLILNNIAIADQKINCKDVIRACDSALSAKDAEIKQLNLGITDYSAQNKDLNAELQRKNSQLESPLRNPFIMGTLGALLGGLAIGFALRK